MNSPNTFSPEIYAIDFGTSNSLLAAANRHAVHPAIPLDQAADDPTVLRSILFFPEESNSECLVGRAALSQYVEEGMTGRLVRSTKRFLPFPGFERTYINGRKFTLSEIVAILLRELKTRADDFFSCDVKRVLLGRPARFSKKQVEDTLAEERLGHAARLAGFEQVAFCPEPIAAARDFEDSLTEPKLVLIGDFGGGTSDFSLVRLSRSSVNAASFGVDDILATYGVSVAGDALDGALARHKVAKHLGAEVTYRVPLGSNVLTMPTSLMSKLCSPAELSFLQQREVRAFLEDVRGWSLGGQDRKVMDQLFCLIEDALGFQLFEAIEATKRRLSVAGQSEFLFDVPGINIQEDVSRREFEYGARRPLAAIMEAMDETLLKAQINADEVDLVCLTGGTARVPAIRGHLERRFGKQRVHHLRGFHSVVAGLAHQARRSLLLGEPDDSRTG